MAVSVVFLNGKHEIKSETRELIRQPATSTQGVFFGVNRVAKIFFFTPDKAECFIDNHPDAYFGDAPYFKFGTVTG